MQTTDFVQIEHHIKEENKEPITFWRNALYVMHDKDGHVVIYTDGTKEILNNSTKIRKVKTT